MEENRNIFKYIVLIISIGIFAFGGYMMFTTMGIFNKVLDKIDDTVTTTTTSEPTKTPDNKANITWEPNTGVAYFNKDAKLSDIKREKGKVNIYIFWGNGCPHCKALWQWLDTIRNEYGANFNAYGFEIWGSAENKKILSKFEKAVGQTTDSVPFIIMGNRVYSGFYDEIQNSMLDYIKTQNSTVDVYFDKISK